MGTGAVYRGCHFTGAIYGAHGCVMAAVGQRAAPEAGRRQRQ